jgi:hypothetical protein
MPSDPYRNLAEIFEGALSLVDYYARRMNGPPASVYAAKAALQNAIADLKNKSNPERND